jgi:hypothetical protein
MDMNKATEWAKSVWHGLPHQAQAAIVVFASAAATFAGKTFFDPASCWSLVCIKHSIGACAGAGLIALRAFYMRPGKGPHPDETVYSGS